MGFPPPLYPKGECQREESGISAFPLGLLGFSCLGLLPVNQGLCLRAEAGLERDVREESRASGGMVVLPSPGWTLSLYINVFLAPVSWEQARQNEKARPG